MADVPTFLTADIETIRAEMLASFDDRYSTDEGGIAHAAIMGTALALYDVGVVGLKGTLQRMFIETMPGPFLDLAGDDMGVARKDAAPSLVTLRFTGTAGAVIPTGYRASTAGVPGGSPVVFATLAGGTIAVGQTTVDVAAEAVEGGEAGNVAATTITRLSTPLSGVSAVSNPAESAGGADEETDDAYRARLLDAARAESGCGNIDWLESTVTAMDGVGAAFVNPLWNGPGTVRVVILDSAGAIPDAPLVAAVQAAIDPTDGGKQGKGYGSAQIGQYVTVVAPVALPIVVTVPNLEPDSGTTLAAAKVALEAAADAYSESLSPGAEFKLNDLVAAMIGAAGVADFGDVLINGVHANVQLVVTEKAALTTPLTYT